MSSGPKRHHYVPKMLLRRFSQDQGSSANHTFVLDVERGEVRRSSIDNYAVIKNFYTLDDVPEEHKYDVEQMLSSIEGWASQSIERLVARDAIALDDIEAMAMFLWVSWARTPLGRQTLAFVTEQATLAELIRFAIAPDAMDAFLEEHEPQATHGERDALKKSLVNNLLDSGVEIDFGSDYQAFAAIRDLQVRTQTIMTMFRWRILFAPDNISFVLSDHPVAIVDKESPKDEPVAWLSSPTVEITLPIDKSACLCLSPAPLLPGQNLRVGYKTIKYTDVVDINLRSYAHSQWEVYGDSAEALKSTRRSANKNRRFVKRYRPRGVRVDLQEQVIGEPEPFRTRTIVSPITATRSRGKSK